MSQCLREDTLLILYSGEGTATERAHLSGCHACETRYTRLAHDLQLIGRVLSEAPPPRTSAHRLIPQGIRWMPVAAALAGMLILALATTEPWSPRPVQQVAARTTNYSAFVEDVSAALFEAPTDVSLTEPASDVVSLQAALAGDWPCTRDQYLNGECDNREDAYLYGYADD